jgi:hypothetical protein
LPYLVGAGSAVGVAIVAVRLSRRDAGSPAGSADTPDAPNPQIDERLDDELRNLD